MNYWLDLFTWTTWQEFLAAGGNISGFRRRRWRSVQQMNPGDIFLCYLTGLSRFIGLLEVTGEPFLDESPIWKETEFPARIPVRVLLELPPEHGVPVKSLRSKLSYFQDMKSPHAWTGHFRGSPTREKPEDAAVIIEALEQAKESPVERPFDKRKLERKVPLFETRKGIVTIPDEDEEPDAPPKAISPDQSVSHEEIQWLLLDLGSQMGLDVWAARNDKSKDFNWADFWRYSKNKRNPAYSI
jgi:predicted RNA-binding protein